VNARRNAFVLGGGVAGLAASFGLADAGFRVVLLESRGWLGGRAFASVDRGSGRRLDNGPHVMLGCYRAMRSLLRRLGTEHGFAGEASLRLAWRRRGGALLRLRLSRLPVPLAMPAALLALPIPLQARWRAFAGMLATLRRTPPEWTLGDWLQHRGQLGEPDALLWRPLCRAIMNVEPEAAAAHDFVATLREAFGGGAGRAAFLVPTRPWSELLGDPAVPALARAGVDVRLGARVQAITATAGAATGIVLADDSRLAVGPDDLVVSALPWRALRAVWPGLPATLGDLESSPIVSVYVTMPANAPPLPDDGPVTALVDGDPFHFVLRTPGGDARQVALLAGGNRSFDGQTVEAIGARALAQLAAWYPGSALGGAEVVVRKEHHATFVAACGSERRRPAPGRLAGGPPNLLVCGDWTATGLPATLEGAARSAATMLAAIDRR